MSPRRNGAVPSLPLAGSLRSVSTYFFLGRLDVRFSGSPGCASLAVARVEDLRESVERAVQPRHRTLGPAIVLYRILAYYHPFDGRSGSYLDLGSDIVIV